MASRPLLPTLAPLAAGVLFAFACTATPNGGATGADTAEPPETAAATVAGDEAIDAPAVSQLTLADFTLHFPSPPAQAKLGCTEPKPPESPCTTPCKPCLQWRCVDGEWQPRNLDWGILCEPPVQDSGQDLGDRPTICPRAFITDDPDAPGWCPLGCDICF